LPPFLPLPTPFSDLPFSSSGPNYFSTPSLTPLSLSSKMRTCGGDPGFVLICCLLEQTFPSVPNTSPHVLTFWHGPRNPPLTWYSPVGLNFERAFGLCLISPHAFTPLPSRVCSFLCCRFFGSPPPASVRLANSLPLQVLYATPKCVFLF